MSNRLHVTFRGIFMDEMQYSVEIPHFSTYIFDDNLFQQAINDRFLAKKKCLKISRKLKTYIRERRP